MPAARALRDVFTDLIGQGGRSGDASEVLRAGGHADLPDGLVAEAVVNFADTAPIEVGEHLARYVAAHSAVPQLGEVDEPVSWLEALTSAPVGPELDPGTELDAADLHQADLHQPAVDQPAVDQPAVDQPAAVDPIHPASDSEIDGFGTGNLDHDPAAGLDATPRDTIAELDSAAEAHEIGPLDLPVPPHPVGGEPTLAELDDLGSDEQTPDDPFEA
jgi:hypothetical protein